MNTNDLITKIQEYKQGFAKDLDEMNYDDPTLYDYAEGVVDSCDFILSLIQPKE